MDDRRAPADAGGGAPLTLALALAGNLRPSLRDGSLRLEGHGVDLSYVGLYVTDARGRRLPAWLSLYGRRLTIGVDDSHARYPLRIDPFVQQAELTPSDAVSGGANPSIGTSVAISADGSTIVAGAPFKSMNTPAGAAQSPDTVYVFTRPASGWSNATQTAELTPSSDGLELGYSVAVSADGSTIVAGAPGDAASSGTSFTGAAYVFSRPAGGWTNGTETAKLTGSDSAGKLGTSVAISADGSTIVAGAPNHSTGGAWDTQGAAYVFARPGSGWTSETQTAELTGSDSISTASLGGAVAISPSGDTVFAGASGQTVGANNGQGAVYAFAKPGSGWANGTQSAELTASDGAAGDGFGSAVAATDAALAVGAPGHTVGSDPLATSQGAAYVFVKPAGGWTPSAHAVELTLSSGMPAGGFGKAIAISGQTVAVGAPDEPYGPNIHQGLVYVATFASDWSGLSSEQQVVAANGADYDGLGGAVGLAGGSLAAAASNAQVGDALHAGAVYVFGSAGASGGGAGGSGGGSGTGGSGSGTGGGTAAGSVSLGRVNVTGTTASVPISCKGAAGTSCAVTVSLSVVERLAHGRLVAVSASGHHPVRRARKKSKTVLLGKAKVRLGAGKHKLVRVALNRSGRRLLAARHKLHVRLVATESSAGHTSTVAHRTITFTARRPKRRHHR